MTSRYGPFVGDGRRADAAVAHDVVLPDAVPATVTLAQARVIIDRLVETGRSTHSGLMSTLWVAIAWCAAQRRPYRITVMPRLGATIELIGHG